MKENLNIVVTVLATTTCDNSINHNIPLNDEEEEGRLDIALMKLNSPKVHQWTEPLVIVSNFMEVKSLI